MKLLIIKLGALGDVIASTAIIKQICLHHNHDRIHLLTSPQFKHLFVNFTNLTVHPFNRTGLLNTLKTVCWIRQQHFDRIYDLQSNDRTSIYCALSGSPFRVGNHPRYPYHAHPENKYTGECHSFDRLNQILQSANINKADPLPYLPIPEESVTKISSWLEEHDLISKPFVLFHAGSSPLHKEKRWPFFSELATVLSKRYSVIWLGGNDDADINAELSKTTGINSTNAFNIPELVQLGKKAKFAVTNDSAPMHILSCSQIPVFGLFGPTYARRTHALGQFDNVITPNNFIAKSDMDFNPVDISNISIDAVLNKIKSRNLL